MGRKRKMQKKSHVISVRLTCEEVDELHTMMEHLQIGKMSELMRQVIGFMRGDDLNNVMDTCYVGSLLSAGRANVSIASTINESSTAAVDGTAV